MTRWHEGSMTGFDLETTGADPLTARIVTAAIVSTDSQVRQQPDTRTWLADPGVGIPAEAAAIHGVTTEHAREHGTQASAVVAELIAKLWHLPCPLVIYNAPYDLTVLDREARRHGLMPLDLTGMLIVDPLVLDKHLDKYRRGSRKLTATAAHYGVQLDDAHTANADALAAMRVAWRIARRYPVVAGMSATDLMRLQTEARRIQAVSLADYFRKSGNPQPVAGDWPVIPFSPDLEDLTALERT